MKMKLTSAAFKEGQPIPPKYTGEGDDVSPPLTIEFAPAQTVSFAIIVEDPDAPSSTFDHWIAWNLPGNQTDILEATHVPMLGQNHFLDLRYRGPMPPKGREHRYFFKVYALDQNLSLKQGSTKEQLMQAMEGHILDEAQLMGTYQR